MAVALRVDVLAVVAVVVGVVVVNVVVLTVMVTSGDEVVVASVIGVKSSSSFTGFIFSLPRISWYYTYQPGYLLFETVSFV